MNRPEYPRPQWVRQNWENLNGTWEYKTDRSATGTERGFMKPEANFDERIEVPFCRESRLSGIGDTDFCNSVWYRKELTVSPEIGDKRLLLHIGACDFETVCFIDGERIASHRGGYSSFTFDLTEAVKGKEKALLVLRVIDNFTTVSDNWKLNDRGIQPTGKQSGSYASHGCFYTRTTGIWQTVWLETVENAYLKTAKFYPDIDAKTLTVEGFAENADGMTLRATVSYEGKKLSEGTAVVHAKNVMMTLPIPELHLWEVGAGRLYDISFDLGADHVESYFGMRNIGLKDGKLYLNGKPVFQRLVLDQGFYPDGIYTAPTDAELLGDIERSLAMGFNGARLHEKIFDPRFLYHADRLGYIVWGEHANWGLDISRESALLNFLPEWVEAVERDFNHPSIIGWCPLNETQMNQNAEFVRAVAAVTRAMDSTRLYIEASGWFHVKGIADIVDMHCYDQDPAVFAKRFEPMLDGKDMEVYYYKNRTAPEYGRVTFVSEYGGIHWNADDTAGASWGYGSTPQSPEEFIARFKGLTEDLLFHPVIGGLCYTQLTDVEQEQNGLYTYDRRPKFDPAIFRAVLTQISAFEKNETEGK